MNAPNCKDILNLIPLYIDNILDSKEKDLVNEHINSCQKCREELKLMAAIMGKTQELPEISVPENFHKDLMDKAATLKNKKRTRRITILRRSSAGVAAAAVIALSVVSFGNMNNAETDLTSGDSPAVSATPTPEVTGTPDTDTAADLGDSVRIEVTEKPVQEVQNQQTTPDNTPELFSVTTPTPIADSESSAAGGGGSAAAPEKASTTDAATLSDAETTYIKAQITLDDSNREAVLAVLSQYEKDEIGYKVPDINKVLRQIAELGIDVNAEADISLTSNYIIVK